MSDKQNDWKALEELAASAVDAAQTINEFFNALREAKEQLEAEKANFIKSLTESSGTVPALQEDDFWFPASEPPKESCDVLICHADENGEIYNSAVVPYSKKHNAFNVRDCNESAKTEINPDYWKPLPKRVRVRPQKEF